MNSSKRSRGPLWLVLGVALAAWLVYLGVSATSPDSEPSPQSLLASDLVFAPWNQDTWNAAATQPALIFLLVSDSISKRALDLEAWLRSDSIRTTVAARFLPIRIDRRARPDLAERYAENQVPHLSVLLPSGEALLRLSGEPDTWTEQLVETARYWQDHQTELRDRAEDFWQHQAEDTVAPLSSSPQEQRIALVDSAVFELVDGLVKENRTPALWRTDLDRYLSARNSPGADSVHDQLRKARELRRSELGEAGTLEATRAEWLRAVLELRRYGGLDISAEHLLAAQAEWDKGGPALTAEEAALAVQLAHASGRFWPPNYSGTWLGFDSSTANSLPHVPGSNELDGYLTDALAWLECLLELEDPQWIPTASRLADSLWQLWDPARRALRDKPSRTGYLREVQVYPRAQLGRAATLFDRLARVSGEPRFESRADSCLSGFSPYLQTAGDAATLYGEALLRRAGAT